MKNTLGWLTFPFSLIISIKLFVNNLAFIRLLMFAPPLPLCPWIEQPSNKCVCLLCEIRSNQRCQIFLWVVTEWEKCLEIRTYKTNTEAILLSQLIYNYRYLKLVVPFFYCNQKVIQRDISLLLTLIWSGIFSRNSLPFNIQFFSSVFIL